LPGFTFLALLIVLLLFSSLYQILFSSLYISSPIHFKFYIFTRHWIEKIKFLEYRKKSVWMKKGKRTIALEL